MRVLVITANVSGHCSNTFVPQNIPNVDFVKLDKSNYTTRTKAMEPRLQGKIPKMLAWELYPDYDYYLWIDSIFSFKNADSVQWYLNQLGDKDAAFYRHDIRKSIKDEVYHVLEGMKNGSNYLIDRYKDERMEEQVATYLKDPNYNDDMLFSAGVFIYSAKIVSNRENNAMKEWFYQNCMWSVQDQLSLPYVLQKYNVNYNIINENIYASLESK